ncbi:MAG TPA: hypothetical protein VGS79_08260 [Puia sp.]|nr:hypothetical protein [Puia sp.]
MKKLTDAGPYFYAVAVAAFGVIQLVTQNFLTGLFPVPAGLPLRAFWVDLCSILFLLAGAGLALRVRPYLAAALAGYVFFLFFFSVHLPKMLTDIYNPNAWSPAFEALMLGSGAFIIAHNISKAGWRWRRLTGIGAVAGIYLFALSLVVFAVLHIRYNAYIMTLMPGWMPAHVFLSYLVIAGFLLSSFSLFTNLKVPLASGLLGIMFLLWVLILHGPRVIGNWNVENEWASLFVSLAVSGIAFSICRRATAGGIDWEPGGPMAERGMVRTPDRFVLAHKGKVRQTERCE